MTWSLQEVLLGTVPQLMAEPYPGELIALVRAHAIDAGIRHAWDVEARLVVQTTLTDTDHYRTNSTGCSTMR